MTASYELNGKLISAAQFYAIACDPRRSVAVEACAGAGKTWMLVSRMLRALLEDDASEPHEILAITFTKKAAGEMRQRLQEWLAKFAFAPIDSLNAELVSRGLSPEAAKHKRELLQNLYQTLLTKGRGVQIRTFHGWFAALLRTAPLSVLQDLKLPANYQLLEDDQLAVPSVWRRFYAALLVNAALKQDFEDLVAEHGRSQALKALDEALSKRVEFTLADAAHVVEKSVPHFAEMYPEFLGLTSVQNVLQTSDMHRQLFFDAAKVLGAAKQPSFSAKGVELEVAVSSADLDAALLALLTASGTKRKFNAALCANEAVENAQALALRLQAARQQQAAWQHQQSMTRLTRLLIAEFTALKHERGWVDMNDVERAAQHMLSDVQMSGWVQERLDARVKHVMIDEFQDTSPLQWQALYAWLAGYAGAGSSSGSASGAAPSVFIVGDPKQSIYRFRRAEPQVFVAAQKFVLDGLDGALLSCDHTHRNVPEVINVVNTVMQTAQMAGEYANFRAHSTAASHTGRVLQLPQIQRDALKKSKDSAASQDAELHWRDSLTEPRVIEDEKLVTLECQQAAAFVAQQIQAGNAPREIMVLARKRARLTQMQLALQALGIASQQPEKSALADAPEVQDVMALLDALVSTTHDLSLARALKSPLFGLSDQDLVEIVLHQRAQVGSAAMKRQSWFDALLLLQNSEQCSQHIRRVGAVLLRWKAWLKDLPPHDALDAIYHDGDVLAKFACAAPATRRASVLANLNALLSAALDINAARYATPYAFVRAMVSGRQAASENGMVDVTQTVQAPVASDSNAVRLLTIHGAKGLEADLVLLLDTDARPANADTMRVLVDWQGEDAYPRSLVFMASEKAPAPSVIEAFAEEIKARQREELNALYVAMTRAKQHLVLSSIAPHGDSGLTWWKRLQDQAVLCPISTDEANPLAISLNNTEHKRSQDELEPGNTAATFSIFVLPELDEHKKMPIASVIYGDDAIENIANIDHSASTLELDKTTRLASNAVVSASIESQIGQAMHRLLQCLPCHASMPQPLFTNTEVQAVAAEFALGSDQALQAAAMAQRIATGEGAWAWRPELIDWAGNELELFANGQLLRLDRLVRRKDTNEWWVLDYKSESQPQTKPELVAQLQAYRAAVQTSQAGETVRAAFLTAAGRLIVL